jgi:arginase family enzyme
VSRLRARCPFCRTLTAVAMGPDYECHSCGRSYGAGLVRVPRAWGDGGEAMARAAVELELPYPDVAVVEEDSLGEQSLAIAFELPVRPLVLGGCCCSHVGAVEALAARHDKLAVVWLDAHGDLNTPESSPSGNAWGMPLRMLIDSGALDARRIALVGARNLDPPEERFITESGLHAGEDAVEAATADVDCVYVALDVDVLDPATAAPFMPEPGGPAPDEVEALLRRLGQEKAIVGVGFTGGTPSLQNSELLTRFAAALGL